MHHKETAAQKHKAPQQTFAVGLPTQLVTVDILDPLPESGRGNRYILVAGDHFTHLMEAYAIPNQEAETVAQKLTEELFFRFSPPKQLHSDGNLSQSWLHRSAKSLTLASPEQHLKEMG